MAGIVMMVDDHHIRVVCLYMYLMCVLMLVVATVCCMLLLWMCECIINRHRHHLLNGFGRRSSVLEIDARIRWQLMIVM